MTQDNQDTGRQTHRRVRLIALVLALAVVTAIVAAYPGGGAQAGDPGSMAEMHYDMNPAGNTATSLGSVQTCARINENNVLDADEDNTPDTADFDITAVGIPGGQYAMIGFQVIITYDESALTVTANNIDFLLAAEAGSSPFSTSDPLPDTKVNGYFTSGALDTAPFETTAESGSGVLSRIGISSDPGAAAGQYLLDYDNPVHIDTMAEGHLPQSRTVGAIAIDEPCGPPPTPGPTPTPSGTPGPTASPVPTTPPPSVTATPTPGTQTPTGTPNGETPTATPVVTPTPTTGPSDTPSPTPSGEFAKGDVQCDNDIDAVDALTIQRDIAELPTSQQPDCPAIGGPAARVGGQGSEVFGDINCNDAIDAVDSLFILRHVAKLPVNLPGGCSPIGS